MGAIDEIENKSYEKRVISVVHEVFFNIPNKHALPDVSFVVMAGSEIVFRETIPSCPDRPGASQFYRVFVPAVQKLSAQERRDKALKELENARERLSR